MIYIAYGSIDYLLETRIATSSADRGAVSALHRMDLGALVEAGAEILDVYGEIGVAVVKLRQKEAAALIKKGLRLEESKEVRAHLKDSAPLVGAPEVWKAGYTGKGVKIAIIDTGVTPTCGLEGKIAEAKSFIGEPPEDLYGHGTHVAAIAASDDGEYRGVAPGAQILNYKALNKEGIGRDYIAARAVLTAAMKGADVINMSFGARGHPDDLLSRVVNAVAARGIVPVASAGNDGPEKGTITSPGTAAHAITVGATDKRKRVAPYSSRGPVGDLVKPDLVAPGGVKGQEIIASRPRDIEPLCKPVGVCYMGCIGTSMAAPHVAGAAALLIEAMGGRKADTAFTIKKVLIDTAEDLGEDKAAQGAGLLRIDKALGAITDKKDSPPDAAPINYLTIAAGLAGLAIIGAALFALTQQKTSPVPLLRQLYKNGQITLPQLVELYKNGKITFDELKKIIE